MNAKPKECRGSGDGDLCACMKESDEAVLARIADERGQPPPPFQVLSLRPGAVSAFSAYRDQVFEGGPLSARDRALVQLTAAVALRLSSCIGKLAKAARKAGVGQDEIAQATLIASIQSATSMLHTAHEGISTP